MEQEDVKTFYVFNKKGIENITEWAFRTHLKHLQTCELILLNTAVMPLGGYVILLLFSWIPGMKFIDDYRVWYWLWGYLFLSASMFVAMYVMHPKPLSVTARTRASKEIEGMLYDAHVKSEISELTGED